MLQNIVVTATNLFGLAAIYESKGNVLNMIVFTFSCIASVLYHGSKHPFPLWLPEYTIYLLWIDRMAAACAIIRSLYLIITTQDVLRVLFYHGYDAKAITIVGLLGLFISDVILQSELSWPYVISHSIWHICAFLMAANILFLCKVYR